MIFDIIKIVLLFTAFGLLHSLLASFWIKNKIIYLFKEKIAFYRLFYNIFSIMLLLLVLIISPKINIIINKLYEPYNFILIIPFFIGLTGIIFTLRYISILEFLGIKQIIRYFNNTYSIDDLDEQMNLRIEGSYKYTRHPLYFFSILILFSIPEMTVSNFTIIFCIVIYFYIGSIFEEKKLEKVFGETYLNYKKKVPRIIPTFRAYNE